MTHQWQPILIKTLKRHLASHDMMYGQQANL
ncbi:MucR family transcriptional regulator [Polynucleobacter yangtzensis]|nr:MucR family transcriptional regulator [Polynucleobacter yangtzensis]